MMNRIMRTALAASLLILSGSLAAQDEAPEVDPK
mgnify:CR=1 FL=1